MHCKYIQDDSKQRGQNERANTFKKVSSPFSVDVMRVSGYLMKTFSLSCRNIDPKFATYAA